jgi:hypothetical protein
MPADNHCDECRAIMEEIRLALAGDLASSERHAGPQGNLEAFQQMLQGSEQAEEDSPRMRQAMRRALEHATRTGHFGLFERR